LVWVWRVWRVGVRSGGFGFRDRVWWLVVTRFHTCDNKAEFDCNGASTQQGHECGGRTATWDKASDVVRSLKWFAL
jgi:hypothetical protein